MLSRVADSLYWMSRYLERAEHTARLIDVDFQLRLDQSPEAGSGRWLRLLEALQAPVPEDGKIDATTHGEGWQYIQLGRYVERTDAVARLIGTHLSRLPYSPDQAVESEEYLEWVGLLKSCAAFEAYCKKYTAELRPLRVAEFLLLNLEFPHSVRFSVDMVHAALRAIAELTERKAEQPVRLAGRLRATLSFGQIDEIIASGASAYVQSVRQQCGQAHTAIHQIYFDYPVETALAS